MEKKCRIPKSIRNAFPCFMAIDLVLQKPGKARFSIIKLVFFYKNIK